MPDTWLCTYMAIPHFNMKENNIQNYFLDSYYLKYFDLKILKIYEMRNFKEDATNLRKPL